jgi:hypothetical protein
MKAIEKRPAATAAELISTINLEAIDTARAPHVERRRVRGAQILQAIQRRIHEITTNSTVGASAIAIQSGVVKVTAAGVAAMTLAAPTAAQEGTEITITSFSANAHTITATGLINDGVTGGSKTTATFAAFAGASLTLLAIGLKWSVKSSTAVVIS